MVLRWRFRRDKALAGGSNVALKEKVMSKRRALITGASKGIGREVANRLASSDFEVIGVARTRRPTFPDSSTRSTSAIAARPLTCSLRSSPTDPSMPWSTT
jgi:phosphoglycerate dehydrogenase-like enzyme